METERTQIKFAVYIWRSRYVLKSQFGHYLGKDGHIHNDAVENCQWDDRKSAGEFLEEWNHRHDFCRTETVTMKG